MQVGDNVIVSTHAHQQLVGTICHITKDASLFIFSTSSEPNKRSIVRLRILSKDIRKCVQRVETQTCTNKRDEDSRKVLTASQIESIISSALTPDGSNHYLIAASFEMGTHHFPIDFDQAMYWYSTGHDLGNIQCTVALAQIHEEYYHDYERAEKYWLHGTQQGYTYCAYAANVMFRRLATQNVANAKQKELFYIEKCIELTNGEDSAPLLDFAVCQLTMDTPDYSQAYEYLQKALQLNAESIGIQQFLAIVLYGGLGCDRDEEKAIAIHTKLADTKQSECSLLWLSVLNAMNSADSSPSETSMHPLRDEVYDAFINVLKTGDSHGLFYGNWIKIVEYHALKRHDPMNCALFVVLNIFGFLECAIDTVRAKKCILQSKQYEHRWLRDWQWLFTERYALIKQMTGVPVEIIDIMTHMELSIIIDPEK